MRGVSLTLFCITMTLISCICAGITVRLWRVACRGLRDSRRYEAVADKARELQLYREMDHYTCRADSRRVWCIFGSPYCPWKPVTPRDVLKN